MISYRVGARFLVSIAVCSALGGLRLPLVAQRASAPALARIAVEPSPPLFGTLSVIAALVGENLEVKPVPLHALDLVSDAAAGEKIAIRTGLDGKRVQRAPSGSYHLRSMASVTIAGRAYSWNEQVVIRNGQTTTIELTNANAHVDSSAAPPAAKMPSARHIAPEIEVYERVKRGVFRVEAGLDHGSGFLVDTLGGIILTNDHVVGAATKVTVVIDSVTRVEGQVVARDVEADVAVIRIAGSVCPNCPRLPLAAGENARVMAGERLMAIGYPLNQDQSLTTGIASSVRDGAIISDVNINHGNSGGPMLAMHGEVVAINTFGDFTSAGGPGVSGSIVIGRAGKALRRALAPLDTLPMPGDARLPMMPRSSYPLAALKAVADTATIRRYRKFADMDAVKFEISVTTPVVAFVRARSFEAEVGKDRKKREDRSELSDEERYSELKGKRDWEEYVGNERAPVVSLAINPKVGETGGSLFKRLMLGPNLKATYKYKGDVRAVQIYRNGDSASVILGGHQPLKAFIDNVWVQLKDVADMGYYILDPQLFAPDPDGNPPSIVVEVTDLKRPETNSCRELPVEVVANAWNDFEPYYAEGRPGEIFVRANPKAKRRRAAYMERFLLDCEWSAY
jgi:S1-C subfamily serine protease